MGALSSFNALAPGAYSTYGMAGGAHPAEHPWFTNSPWVNPNTPRPDPTPDPVPVDQPIAPALPFVPLGDGDPGPGDFGYDYAVGENDADPTRGYDDKSSQSEMVQNMLATILAPVPVIGQLAPALAKNYSFPTYPDMLSDLSQTLGLTDPDLSTDLGMGVSKEAIGLANAQAELDAANRSVIFSESLTPGAYGNLGSPYSFGGLGQPAHINDMLALEAMEDARDQAQVSLDVANTPGFSEQAAATAEDYAGLADAFGPAGADGFGSSAGAEGMFGSNAGFGLGDEGEEGGAYGW